MRLATIGVLASLLAASCFQRPPPIVATYGDSTQEGQGNPHYASRPGYKILNRGMSGTNLRQLLTGTDGKNAHWEVEMATSNARVVVINHALNDNRYSLELYRDALVHLVTVAQQAGKIVILEQPNPVGYRDTPLMVRLRFKREAFELRRNTMREVAEALGAFHCDQPRVQLEDDDFHPTIQGLQDKGARLAWCIKSVL